MKMAQKEARHIREKRRWGGNKSRVARRNPNGTPTTKVRPARMRMTIPIQDPGDIFLRSLLPNSFNGRPENRRSAAPTLPRLWGESRRIKNYVSTSTPRDAFARCRLDPRWRGKSLQRFGRPFPPGMPARSSSKKPCATSSPLVMMPVAERRSTISRSCEVRKDSGTPRSVIRP